MNKKFLSAILFGALMVSSTGTFVSCKDYDDDIDDLQEQINKLATKEDMTSQIASLQSALTAAQSEATAAKTTAQEALTKANGIAATASDAEKAAAKAAVDAAKAAVDAANAKAEAIKAAQDEVAKVKAELEAAIDKKFEATKNDLAKTIADLTKKVEEMTGYTTSMVTSIHFVVNEEKKWDTALDLNYAKVAISYPKNLVPTYPKDPSKPEDRETPDSYTFGEGMTGAFTLTKGEINTVSDKMYVNVAPVNAAISAESLSLINGNAGNVNSYVDYSISTTKLDFEKPGASRAAATSTGLREVKVQLKKDVDFEAFDKMVITGKNHPTSVANCDGKDHTYIAYALAVTDSKSRSVTSDFDVTMHVQNEKKAENINISSKISCATVDGSKSISLYAAGGDESKDPEKSFPVELNGKFTIKVSSTGGRVMASYVMVDKENENLSVTDKAALQGVTVSGVGNVAKNNTHTLSISGTYAAGVVVPLKVVSIDYTGNVEVNVVWVKANEPVSQVTSFTLTPKANVATPTAWAVNTGELQAFKVPATATKYTVSMVVGETNHEGNYTTFATTNGIVSCTALNAPNAFLKLYKDINKNTAADNGEVAYAEFVGTVNLQVMREDKAYPGTVRFYNAKGDVVGVSQIKVTKVLPTAVPANFSAKTNAINNGVLTVYPEPQNDADNNGNFKLDKAFNNWNLPDYDLVINGITNTNPVNGTYDGAGYSIKDINKDVIKPAAEATAYATTVSYDYGDIKFHPEGHGANENIENCVINWTSFSTKFGCMITDSKYSWINTPKVYYRENVLLNGTVYDAEGKATDKNVIYVTDPYGKEVDPFDATDTGWTTWAGALNESTTIKLITNGNRVNEFFTAKFAVAVGEGGVAKTGIQLTKTSTEVVLSGDVETTVVLVITDKFGHTHEVKALTFTMKKDHSGDAK